MNITCVGIDLAKNSFSIGAVDERGSIVLERTSSGVSYCPVLPIYHSL